MSAGVAGVWYGKLDPVTGLALLGTGLSIAGLSAKANRHQAELLTALDGVAQAGADIRAGNRGLALVDAEATAGQLAPVLSYTQGLSAVQSPAVSLHLSADSVQELAIAVQHLAGHSDDLLGPIEVISRGAVK